MTKKVNSELEEEGRRGQMRLRKSDNVMIWYGT